MDKKMCISARCGTKEKKVIFPVTPEFEEYLRTISHNTEDVRHFEVEGGKSVSITLTIFNYGEKF